MPRQELGTPVDVVRLIDVQALEIVESGLQISCISDPSLPMALREHHCLEFFWCHGSDRRWQHEAEWLE